ncbi:MAG: glycosyltransferase family 4 protein [Cyanobacteria bacterium P01_A01_bin.123]
MYTVSRQMNNTPKVAWLLPVTWFYWQPTLSKFTQLFPKTQIFTALWPGYAQGFEDTLKVEVLGEFKVLKTPEKRRKYGTHFKGMSLTFTQLPLNIVSHLLEAKPDIVFTSSFGVWTLAAALLKVIGRWKLVVAYEGSSPRADRLDSAPHTLLRKAVVSSADAFITNSRTGQQYLTNFLNADAKRVFVFPYEIPAAESLLVSQDDTPVIPPDEQRPIFLFVGRLMPRKGVHTLLEACTLLKRRGYDGQFTVLVVGDGEERESLEAISQENQLERCVKWLGRVDYEQISCYFRQSDVFVLPTLEDTWGVVVLEAMLMGKPVLCSTGAGSSEMITQGKNGYVFTPEQPEQLADIMEKFIESPELAQKMGNCSQEIMARCTPESASQNLAKVVTSLTR